MAQAVAKAEPGIDFPTLCELVGFKPHSQAQKEYLYSNSRFNIPCCGRRWGKTQPTGHRITYKSFVPNSYNWIVGPKYSLGEKEFRLVYYDYEKLGLLKYCKKAYNVKQGDMRIETPWKSIVQVVSSEKRDSLLGEGLSHACMSEAAQHDQATWEQYIEPALSDLLGTADFPSTPKGFNWYHGMWMLGQGALPDYKSWQLPSWTNPIRYPGGINNTEIQRIKSVSSKVWFDQEYGASFTSISGSIYEEWDSERHVVERPYNPRLPNYLAFDYGFSNPFVALDIQLVSDEHIHVWREYYQRYKTTLEHAEYLRDRENPEGYHINGMWGDPRGADEAATIAIVLRQGTVQSFDVSWKLSVEHIKRMLKADPPRITVDPSCTNFLREFPQLHVKPLTAKSSQDLNEQTSDGNIQHKVNDHSADALRYFVGPHFVAGAGSSLADIYGEDYVNSESKSFYESMMMGSVTLEDELTLGKAV